MPNSWFQFKRFRVEQSGAAMKVGTDGTLLGAWAGILGTEERILDIGTGTGLIALMMAQKTEDAALYRNGKLPRIDAIDIDADACITAGENFKASPWAGRLRVINAGIHEFTRQCMRQTHPYPDTLYDHIISNPPYFINALTSPEDKRTIARHTSSLTYEELTMCATKLLKNGGIFSVVIPAENEKALVAAAEFAGLAHTRKCSVYSLPGLPPKRSLLEFSLTRDSILAAETSSLTIEEQAGGYYTEKYKDLTRDFYLKF